MGEAAEVAGKLAAPLEKFITTISDGIGKVYEPRYIKKMADAEAYKIDKMAETMRKNWDMQITCNSDGTAVSMPEFEEFNQRMKSRVIFQELEKQKNIESVTGKAYSILESEENVSDESVDKDWTLRFFNSVEDISNEQMQEIWARILAGEVKKPGTVSLRTLETLHNMTQKEAMLFEKLCSHCIIIAGACCVLHNDAYFKEFNIPFEMILKLSECGLINSGSFLNVCVELNEKSYLAARTDDYIAIANTNAIKTVEIKMYPLTTCGTELSKIVGCHMALDEFKVATRTIGQMTSIQSFKIHHIREIKEEQIEYDESENLLDE